MAPVRPRRSAGDVGSTRPRRQLSFRRVGVAECARSTGCVGPGTGWTPAHLSVWRGSHLVGVAPSYLKSNSEGEFVFDWAWADAAERVRIAYYPKIVVAVPFTPATGDRVLVAPGENRVEVIRLVAAAARDLCTKLASSGIHVLFPRETEANVWRAEGYLLRDGMQFHWARRGATTWDDFLERFPSKRRTQIRRELRDVRNRGIEIRTLEPDEITVETARLMHSYYASTVEKHGAWGRLLNERFFERIVQDFRHRLAWVVARDTRSGEAVAGAFNVVKGSRLYGRYWGTRAPGGSDIPFLHFAVCYYEGIRHCIERGLDVFEPGAGGERRAQLAASCRRGPSLGSLAPRPAPPFRTRAVAGAGESAGDGSYRGSAARVMTFRSTPHSGRLSHASTRCVMKSFS